MKYGRVKSPLNRFERDNLQNYCITSEGFTCMSSIDSGVPGILFGGGGFNKFSWDSGQREWGPGGGSPPSQGFWRQL